MADFCLQIMLTPSTHDLGDAFANASRHKRGDIIDMIYPASVATLVGNTYVFNDVIGSPTLAFIFVRGLPDAIQPKQLRHALTSHPFDTYLNTRNKLSQRILRARRFRLRLSLLPGARRQDLIANKHITITWAQAKQMIVKKTVSNRFDVTTDNETVRIADGDLTFVN